MSGVSTNTPKINNQNPHFKNLEKLRKLEKLEITPLLFTISKKKQIVQLKRWMEINLMAINQKFKLLDNQEDQEDHNPAINADFVIKQAIGKTIVPNSEEIRDLADEEDIDLLALTHHLHQVQIVLTGIEEEEENKKRQKSIEKDLSHHLLLQAVIRRKVQNIPLKMRKIIKNDQQRKESHHDS